MGPLVGILEDKPMRRVPCLRAWSRLTLLSVALGAASQAQAQPLPVFPPGLVSDTYFGTVVPDPYRALENVKAPAVAAWMKAHSDHAHRTLQALPMRDAMLAAIRRYDDAVSERVAQVWRVPGGRIFYEKRGAQDNQYKLYTRDTSGRETLLVDPERFARGKGAKPHAINWYVPSRDGRRLAYGMSQAGSESASLRVIDVASGRQLGAAIPRADFGGVAWTADGRRLSFIQLQGLRRGAPAALKYQDAKVVWLDVGARAPRATPALARSKAAEAAGITLLPQETPFVSLTADDRYALAVILNGVQREQRIYAADARAYLAGKPVWQRLAARSDGVVGGAYARGVFYAVTHKDAPRFKLVAAPVDGFDLAKATTVLPPSDRVLSGVAAAADALYVEQRDGNVKRLGKVAFQAPSAMAAGTLVPIALPVDGAFSLNQDESQVSAANPLLPGLSIELQSWTRARQIFDVGPDGQVLNTGLQPAGPNDARDDLVATELSCKSHDGAMVPMSVIHKRGLVLNGRNPTILYGYASYGVTEEPFFSTGRLAWIDAGGVMAVANPRGSGVFGQDWYMGGFQASKPNTWLDFIACAQTLVERQYTSPANLGILGGSAGGILVGRAMTDRPDLFAAVVPAVGSLDTVRAELTPNGVPNIPEFGSHKTEAGFKALLAMSTYHQIKDGVKYPAVLLTHGVNDPRVEVWESTKAAARLMAATSSGKPVLLRLDYDAGHGIGNTKAQQQAERADIYAFFHLHLGGTGPSAEAGRKP